MISEHLKGIEAKIRDKENIEAMREERKETRVTREQAGDRARREREEMETQMRINMGLKAVYDTRMLQVRV